jgi:hypothetical protein
MNPANARICEIIEDLLEGRIACDEFHERSKALPDGATAEAEEAWHEASHYADDEDIRKRDKDYATRTEEKLRWHIRMLRGDQQNAAE